MPLIRKLLLAALLSSGLVCLAHADTGFPQDKSDLKADPAVTWGTLDNGVRYAIMPNAEPKGRASLRLLVKAGSLNETDDQQGLAHFLEHMAFKGSTHYKPGTLVNYFQRLGMGMGSDANANTGMDRTVYQLELPDTKPHTLQEGLQVFADFSGGLLLQPDQIDSERGVILSEKRARDSVAFRSYKAEVGFLLPGSLPAARMPIGLDDVIQQSRRDRFVDLYNTWYQPDRITVVAVGDLNVKQTVALIQKEFGELAPRAPARPYPDLKIPTAIPGTEFGYHYEADAPNTSISIQTLQPFPGQDSSGIRLSDQTLQLALDMLSRRLDILAHKENSPLNGSYAGVYDMFQQVRIGTIGASAKPEQWQAALALVDQQLRSALDHGFTAQELQVAVANLRTDLDQSVSSAATRRSDRLAGAITDALNDGNVYTSPAQDKALLGPLLDKVTPEDCVAALRKAWTGGRRVFVSGNAKLADPQAEIKAAWTQSQSVATTSGANDNNLKFPYTDFGPAGKVVSQKRLADLDVTQVTFANGVRLNLKQTPFQANTINVTMRVGAGRLTEPAATKPGLAWLTLLTFKAGGLDKLSIDDLDAALAGKQVGMDFRVSNDAFTFGGSTNRDNLLLQMQLLTAYLTHAGYRPEALTMARKAIVETQAELTHTPEGLLQTRIDSELANHDPRFGIPDEKVLMSRTLDEVKNWLQPQLDKGPLEVSIVGDIDIDKTIAAVAQTLGTLPDRETKPDYANQRIVNFPDKGLSQRFTVPTEINRGLVYIVWPATDGRDIHLARRFNLLAEVFKNRLWDTIRTQMGSSYSPEAFAQLSETFTGYGMVGVLITVEPEQADKVTAAVKKIAADMQAHGVTDDELERARAPILTGIRDSERTNGYWLGTVLNGSQEIPARLEWARSRASDYQSITKADLDSLARHYLVKDRNFSFTVVPDHKITSK
ncbi:M16 family metallopeptidase [Silvimonas iriomotensis]|uniref:Peptidase M16 n=1 Tax=Silvimonas iriomotensis TaxID=449662 RepID=A0ABQ2P6F1_9NEIS|nr:M16 family metallopeptidase [Silvimonas iriomotensis]GGP19148.1 peptidase M16 [Silvimonas iriomotensis]